MPHEASCPSLFTQYSGKLATSLIAQDAIKNRDEGQQDGLACKGAWLAAMFDNLNATPTPTWWKERSDSQNVSSPSQVYHCMCAHISNKQTDKQINVRKEEYY